MIRKYHIKAFKCKSHLFIVNSTSSLNILYKDNIINDFAQFYKILSNISDSSTPIMTPIIEWKGWVTLQLTRQNVKLIFGTLSLAYSIAVLCLAYKTFENVALWANLTKLASENSQFCLPRVCQLLYFNLYVEYSSYFFKIIQFFERSMKGLTSLYMSQEIEPAYSIDLLSEGAKKRACFYFLIWR